MKLLNGDVKAVVKTLNAYSVARKFNTTTDL